LLDATFQNSESKTLRVPDSSVKNTIVEDEEKKSEDFSNFHDDSSSNEFTPNSKSPCDDNISTFSRVSHSVFSSKTRDGKKKINQYIVMHLLGKGNFGKVMLVYDTDNSNFSYAMKIIKKKKQLKGFGIAS
jgi:hypothetical protein